MMASRYSVLVVLVLFCSICAPSVARPSLKALLQKTPVLDHLQVFENFINAHKAAQQKHGMQDLSVECALCGIAINEVEGLLAENMTAEDIAQILTGKVCSYFSGTVQQLCVGLAEKIPYIVDRLENYETVSVVCVDLGMCAKPFSGHVDPSPIPTYQINLDLAPWQRWQQVCSNPQYRAATQFLLKTINNLLPGHGAVLEDIGELLNSLYLPRELAEEIQGCAAALGITPGWATLFNLGYEATSDCTSIVAQAADGTILHARNMDFGAGMGFTDILRNLTFVADFQRSGKTVFKMTTFAGFVGATSGIKPGGFSLTVNSRFFDNGNVSGIPDIFEQLIWAIEETNASLVTFLTREVLENLNTYTSAFNALSNTNLITVVYYILAGIHPGQGAIITRNPTNSTHLWTLNAPKEWHFVQTNYDHWTQPPWYDNRIVPAQNALNAIGQKDISLSNIFSVLNVKPVLNIETTYSILAVPKNNTYMSWSRWCPFPCVE